MTRFVMQSESRIFFKEALMSKEWPVLLTSDFTATEGQGEILTLPESWKHSHLPKLDRLPIDNTTNI